MYPLSEDRLSIGELVTHWVGSMPEAVTEYQLLTQILSGFWSGELPIFRPGEDVAVPPAIFLDGLRQLGGHSIVFIEDKADIPQPLTAMPDGAQVVDLRHFIVLPRDSNTWTPAEIEIACAVLAGAPTEDFPQGLLLALRTHLVTRNGFRAFIDVHGWRRPSFWFEPGPASEHQIRLAKDETGCQRWLLAQTRSPKRQPKDGYWGEAHAQFATLSARAFERIWAITVAPTWRATGQPKKRRTTIGKLET